ncbi:MAG: complex I subunit 1 family protein [Candidatus Sericytochromatia bacterium]
MSLIDFGIILGRSLFVIVFCLTMVPIMIWLERKIAAVIQDRIGPNRTSIGFLRLGGIIQVVADAVKIFFKEDVTPKTVNKFYFYLAPFIAGAVCFMTFSTIPFADTLKIGNMSINMQVLNIDAGILWFFAIVSLSVYSVVLAGWSSNSKFPLLGGIRSSAQMLSYEVPMGLSIIGLLMIFGTAQLNDIVSQQGELLWGVLPKWGIFLQPVAAIIFIVCAFAETNRNPFDLAEGESELVGGFHTEYSSMKFGLFFMAEYVSIVVSSGLIVTLFFGGWQVPYLSTEKLIQYSRLLSLISLGGIGLVSLFLASSLYTYHQKYKNRWKDSRDYEAIIFSVLSVIVAIMTIGGIGALVAFDLPNWYGPIFALIAQIGIFLVKVFLMCCVFVWVRWTLPRFRYDQLMDLGWRKLLPLALLNIFVTGAVMLFLGSNNV